MSPGCAPGGARWTVKRGRWSPRLVVSLHSGCICWRGEPQWLPPGLLRNLSGGAPELLVCDWGRSSSGRVVGLQIERRSHGPREAISRHALPVIAFGAVGFGFSITAALLKIVVALLWSGRGLGNAQAVAQVWFSHLW